MDASRPNRVLPSLMLAALAAWVVLDMVTLKPNRFVTGEGFRVFEVFGWGGVLGGAVALLLVAVSRLPSALGVLILLLMALPGLLGLAASLLIGGALPEARLGIGPGFWVLLILLFLAVLEVRPRLRLSRVAVWVLMLPVLGSWWVGWSRWLEPLALRQEVGERSGSFVSALLQHLELVTTAIGISLVIGMALTLAMRRYPALRRSGFAALDFVQTLPSLALFGLLLVLLAWLATRVPGLGGWQTPAVGWLPALVALVIYSLPPLVRSSLGALDAVAPAVIESARAMGMSPRQVAMQVRLPLALPAFLDGIRITTVQTVGLTAVAALIGAGGLGSFIFQGLGQGAMDLVLLGALPLVVMALLVDALFRILNDLLRPGAAP